MNDSVSPSPNPTLAAVPRAITVFGVGTAGVALLRQLASPGFAGVRLVAVDSPSPAAVEGMEVLGIARNLVVGQGAHQSEPGKSETEAQISAVKPACLDCETVFILAGLGGRTGNHLAVAVARAAKDAGARVFAFVTLPFQHEGSVRHSKAHQGLSRLQPICDFVFCLPHQDACGELDDSRNLAEVYAPSNQWVLAAVRHVRAALAGTSVMGLAFNDLCSMLREKRDRIIFAVGEAEGTHRSGTVIDRVLAHPRLKGGKLLGEAEVVAVSLVGGQDVRIADLNQAMQLLGKHWSGPAHLVCAGMTPAAAGPLSVLVMVVPEEIPASLSRVPLADAGTDSPGQNKSTGAVTPFSPGRRSGSLGSRPVQNLGETEFVDGTRPREGRGRKGQPRMCQGQLALDISSKGRFEKSEPTIHKGEDLDIPTFLRRGLQFN